MATYSIGKNEIRILKNKEQLLKDEIKKLDNGNVVDIKLFKLKKEMSNIKNKLKILGSSSDGNDIA